MFLSWADDVLCHMFWFRTEEVNEGGRQCPGNIRGPCGGGVESREAEYVPALLKELA